MKIFLILPGAVFAYFVKPFARYIICVLLLAGNLFCQSALAQTESPTIVPLGSLDRPSPPTAGVAAILRGLDLKSVGSVGVLVNGVYIPHFVYAADGFDLQGFINNPEVNLPADGSIRSGSDPILVTGSSVRSALPTFFHRVPMDSWILSSNSYKLAQFLRATERSALNTVRVEEGLDTGEITNIPEDAASEFSPFQPLIRSGDLEIPKVNSEVIEARFGVYETGMGGVEITADVTFFRINPLLIQIAEGYNSLVQIQSGIDIGNLADAGFIGLNAVPSVVSQSIQPIPTAFGIFIGILSNANAPSKTKARESAVDVLRNLYVGVNAIDFSDTETVQVRFGPDGSLTNPETRVYEINGEGPFIQDYTDFPLIKQNDLSYDFPDEGILVACNGCGGFAFATPMRADLPEGRHRFDFFPRMNAGESSVLYGYEFKYNGQNDFSIHDASGEFVQSSNVESLLLGMPDFENGLLSKVSGLPDLNDYEAIDDLVSSNIFELTLGNDLQSELLGSNDLNLRATPFSDASLMFYGFGNTNIVPTMTNLSVGVVTGLQVVFPASNGGTTFGTSPGSLLPNSINQANSLNSNSKAISKAMLPGNERDDLLFTALDENISDLSLTEDLFHQALALRFDQVSLVNADNDGVSGAFEHSDIYPILRNAIALMTEQVKRTLLNGVYEHDLNITKAWMDQLEKSDKLMFDGIQKKIDHFVEKNNLSGDHKVTLVPRLSLDMEITPQVQIENEKLDPKKIDYEMGLVLQNAVIQLGLDHNCDGEAEVSIPLTTEEQAFINEMWAKDVDGDGTIDEGFVSWLQDRIKLAEQRLSLSLTYNEAEAYGQLNDLLKILAVAEWTKQEYGQGRLALPNDLSRSLNSGNLRRWGLQSTTSHRDLELELAEQSIDKLDQPNFGKLNLTIPSLEVNTLWNPLELSLIETSGDLALASSANSGTELALESFAFQSMFSFEDNETEVALDSYYEVQASLTNNGLTTLQDLAVSFEFTTDREMTWYHLKRLEIPQLGIGEMAPLFFSYIPLTTGAHTMRVKVNGEVIFSRRYTVLEDNSSIMDKDAYCTATEVFSDIVESGASTTIQGGYTLGLGKIEPNGTASLEAINRIVLKPGFHAKKGSNFSTGFITCEDVKERLN